MINKIINYSSFGIGLLDINSYNLVDANNTLLNWFDNRPLGINIQSILPSINETRLDKVVAKQRIFRTSFTVSNRKLTHNINLSFKLISIEREEFILIEGCMDDSKLEIEKLISSYENTMEDYKNELFSHKEQLIKSQEDKAVLLTNNNSDLEEKNIELAQQKYQLEQKNKKILATQDQLIQSSKMASLGTMTAGVAHEINNPTNFTYAAVFMMKDEIDEIKRFLKQLAGGDDADPKVLSAFNDKFGKLIELMQTATEGTKRIRTIVEDLRTFARLDGAKKATTKVSTLFTSTIHLIQTQYEHINIEPRIKNDPEITCFPSKLNQVFMNIIVNACQAINSRQKIDNDLPGQVVIETTEHDGQLKIKFTDNGCGMSETALHRIFEPFYTTKSVGSGTGLGMAISFGIIEEHGGTMTVNSCLNKGSEIVIQIPIIRATKN